MCDFSLAHYQSRPAAVEDKLTVHRFPSGSKGFVSPDDKSTAVCVLPGTEISFHSNIVEGGSCLFMAVTPTQHATNVARFRQVDLDHKNRHHDALELANGTIVKLQDLREGQVATILQLPAAPKTAKEAKEQARLEVVA